MKNFDPSRYKYVTTPDNKVIAISSFAGKTVKGVAKCDPNDEFNLEAGKKLAAARCNEKVAKRRLKWCLAIYEQMRELCIYWETRLRESRIRLDAAFEEHNVAKAELEEIEAKM